MEVDASNEPKKAGLFARCSFVIICAGSLTEKDAESLASELRLHDGEVLIDNNDGTAKDIRGITHVVATTSDFHDFHAYCDALIPVLKPAWIQHCLAKDRLVNTRQYSPDPRLFMSDVVVCVADLPMGDADAIAGGILAMGGLFSSRLTNQITHVISLSMDSESCVQVQRKKLNVKIVLPHWVDDCLKLGRKIDEQPYMLPDPEILRPSMNKAPTGKRKTPVEGASDPDPSQQKPGVDPPRKLHKVFKKKAVMLASDLGISPYLRGILEGIITVGGGKLTDAVSKTDMYICKYREGQDYKFASRSGLDVGNLAWLYFLIQTDEWTSPMRRLLHYPVAREGLPGFSNMKISLSNYSGEARTYLENLIAATGAECTKTLKQDNTHLITAHGMSEKCSAAQDWGIHIVNHLWLEESYAKWKLQSVTASRYTHFPKRTNLGDIVGSTQLDRDVLERCFFPDEDVDMTDAPPTAAMRPVNQNAVTATEPKQPSAAKKVNRDQAAKDASAIQPDQVQTPAPPKFIATGKENITPLTGNGRKSKEAAAARLQSMTPDILLYEKERKRVGGVVYGGRRQKDEDRVLTGRKRSVGEALEDVTDDNEAKKGKRGNPPPVMHLMVSGYNKWVNHAKIEENDKKQLRNLGIVCTTDASKASHLAAPHIVRTQKFVTALAYAPLVISTNFIDACLDEDELLDPEDFKLEDKKNEEKLGFSLKLSRERAQKNHNQLLQGRSVYCMENIHGGFDTFRVIVEANGGRCMPWRNRKGTIVPSSRADGEVGTDIDINNDVYLLSDDRKENRSLWVRFKEMVEGSRKQPRIVAADWLLETAMSQQLLPTKQYELGLAA
ncbi:uncharacterized protein Z518_05521 [Rhinocladiella mackenziei CBS 650.93]|uniref:BRCT domain-containing protein n=1 Tax=Rhinocladiella mackenziei CBS 650.93 TaxID=1442369 RepID=A0A0D2INE2_9EURO|nr:uncharacterized protein Z518_05521 [Rhinocladiella mackenziei CBS 650.93]KIX04651.1 hypothetical protein Z518_05521 [Rhinocladiella mackenziei CBS 650.93]